MQSTDMVIRSVSGWQLDMSAEDEPRVRDTDLADRLGYKQPRMVRKLIGRLIEIGEISDVLQRSTVERYESRPNCWQEREVQEYWLTEEQALFVCMASKTQAAMQARKEVARVFMAARRGTLPTALDMAVTAMVTSVSRVSEDIAKLTHIVGSTHTKLDLVEVAVERVEAKVTGIDGRLTLIEQRGRREPRPKDVAYHINFVQSRYRGICPHCNEVEIVRDGVRLEACHIDHFYNRNRASLQDTWAICAACNASKELSATVRERYEPTFKVYQNRLADYQGPLFN